MSRLNILRTFCGLDQPGSLVSAMSSSSVASSADRTPLQHCQGPSSTFVSGRTAIPSPASTSVVGCASDAIGASERYEGVRASLQVRPDADDVGRVGTPRRIGVAACPSLRPAVKGLTGLRPGPYRTHCPEASRPSKIALTCKYIRTVSRWSDGSKVSKHFPLERLRRARASRPHRHFGNV